MPIELATDTSPADPATGLSETDILDCFNDSSILGGQRNYLLAVGRAIEAKVMAREALLRECHLSGQMSAAQSVEHFGAADVKTYCCYGMYAEAGHSGDCKHANIRAARANAGY